MPQRLRYLIPLTLGAWLVFRRNRLPYPLSLTVISHDHALMVATAMLCLCGLGLCLWARAVLGRNWSGTVTLKENHELIVRGPYRLVRHPIYTGILAMFIATAIQQGRVAGLLGLILIFLSLWLKSSQEEELMRQEFPHEYAAYRHRTKRIIPFLV